MGASLTQIWSQLKPKGSKKAPSEVPRPFAGRDSFQLFVSYTISCY